MQIKQIKVDHWYQTKQGIGKCLAAGKRSPPSAKFNITKPIPRGIVYLSPKDVEYEIPEGEEPKEEPVTNDAGFTTGFLRKNHRDRWEIYEHEGNAVELSSGSIIEVNIAGTWIKTTIEHNGKHYYATTQGVLLAEGVPARVKS